VYDSEMIEQLEEIAPVYQFTLRGGERGDWKQRVGEVADAVNKADELDELDDEFEARQKELADQYSDVTEGTTIGVASSFEENSAYLWGSENMLGTILTPLGFDWSADEDAMVEKYGNADQEGNKSGKAEPEAQISLEVLDKSLSDADVIFVDSDLRGDYDKLTEALLDSAVFRALPPVPASHVWPTGRAGRGPGVSRHRARSAGTGPVTLRLVEDERGAGGHDSRHLVDPLQDHLRQGRVVRGIHRHQRIDVAADGLHLLDEGQCGQI